MLVIYLLACGSALPADVKIVSLVRAGCGRRPGAGVETAGGYCGGGLPKDRRIEET